MIGFAGLSHLGIVTSTAIASKGFDVIAYDGRPGVAEALASGQLPILEPGLPELLSSSQSRMTFTSDPAALAQADLIYLSLDVATDADNGSDLSALQQVIDDVVPHAKRGAVLVVLSQVPPGFTRRLATKFVALLDEKGIVLYGQVETLIFGAAVERATKPERYIVGSSQPAAELAPVFAKVLGAFGCPVLVMRYESAELAKISINVFLAASLSATNTMAELCEGVGADWSEIAPTLRLDRRIGPHAYLVPGLGIAGGNIERDLVTMKSLAAEFGAEDCVPRAFIDHSRSRRDWALRQLHRQVLSRHPGALIAVWGLAYKVNTKSVKNSPTLALLDGLPGVAVQLYDPSATLGPGYPTATQVASPLAACQGAHALVIMTAWDEFANIPLASVTAALAAPVVIDPAGSWRARAVTAASLQYSTLGRPPGAI